MERIASALGLLHQTHLTTQAEQEATRLALANLDTLREQSKLDTEARPRLFVASSSEADADVTRAIAEVLKDFDELVSAQHWHEVDRPGNINQQIERRIRGAAYAICYFSESRSARGTEHGSVNGNTKYIDNHNVLVEAGMLHMVTRTAPEAGSGWVPIREKDSPPPPFDFAANRMIIVPRNDDGSLNEQEFRVDLSKKLRALIHEKDNDHSVLNLS